MKFKIEITQNFDKEAKPLLKKYPSFKADLGKLFEELQSNPLLGTSLGHNLFKIRVAITSKGKGKSSSARVITYVIREDEKVSLISVYDKSDYDSVKVIKLLEIAKNEGV